MSVNPCFILFLGVFIGSLENSSADPHDDRRIFEKTILPHIVQCAKDMKISKEDFLKAKENNTFDDCLIACLYDKIGVMKDGVFDIDALNIVARDWFNENTDKDLDEINKIIKECSKVNDEKIEDDEQNCKKARMLFDCYMDKKKE